MKSPVSTSVAIASAIIVIVGILFPQSPLFTVKTILLDWVISITAVAGLIAIFNLLKVHFSFALISEKRNIYSFFFIIPFFIVFVAGLVFGTTNSFFKQITSTVIISVESSLLALLAFSLAAACFRLFQNRKNLMGVIFGISTIIFLISLSGILSVGSKFGFLNDIFDFINQIPIAGIRGMLIGISLGSIAAGIRILIGSDRPYVG